MICVLVCERAQTQIRGLHADRWAAVFGQLTVECDKWRFYPTIKIRWEPRTNVCLPEWLTWGWRLLFLSLSLSLVMAVSYVPVCLSLSQYLGDACACVSVLEHFGVEMGLSWHPWQMMSLSSCFWRLCAPAVCVCVSLSVRVRLRVCMCVFLGHI